MPNSPYLAYLCSLSLGLLSASSCWARSSSSRRFISISFMSFSSCIALLWITISFLDYLPGLIHSLLSSLISHLSSLLYLSSFFLSRYPLPRPPLFFRFPLSLAFPPLYLSSHALVLSFVFLLAIVERAQQQGLKND